MRLFTIGRAQPERISQGMPRYDHGDGTQEEERRFGGSLDHCIAVLGIVCAHSICERKIGHDEGQWSGGRGQGAEVTPRLFLHADF